MTPHPCGPQPLREPRSRQAPRAQRPAMSLAPRSANQQVSLGTGGPGISEHLSLPTQAGQPDVGAQWGTWGPGRAPRCSDLGLSSGCASHLHSSSCRCRRKQKPSPSPQGGAPLPSEGLARPP